MNHTIAMIAAAATLGFASLAQAQSATAQHVHHAHHHVVSRDGVQAGRSVYVEPAFVAQPYYGDYGPADWKRHWGF